MLTILILLQSLYQRGCKKDDPFALRTVFLFSLIVFFFVIARVFSFTSFIFHIVSERAGEEGRDLFLQEIEFMKQIGSHRNVVSMLGYWVKSEPIMLILEYVPHGDLLQWLRSKRQQVFFLSFPPK